MRVYKVDAEKVQHQIFDFCFSNMAVFKIGSRPTVLRRSLATHTLYPIDVQCESSRAFYNNHSFSFFKFSKFGLCYSHTISMLPFSTFITTDHLLIQMMGKRTNASRTSLHAPISRLVRFLNSIIKHLWFL